VFGKVKSKRMLTRKIWDHAIDLKEMFRPQKGKIYLLSKNEREEVQNFVKDQLRKGYIRFSKSPQMSPVFFIGKKDRSKQIVIDYCNLNSQTIVMLLENFLRKYSMGYILYPWISLLEPTLETSYKPQT